MARHTPFLPFTAIIAGQCTQAPAGIYTRRSDDDQSAYSPDAQERICRTACASWHLDMVASYFDDDISGGAWQRPAFDQMKADVRSGRLRVLVVPKIDRFARDVILCLQTIDELHGLGVTVLSVGEPFDFRTPAGRKFLTDTASTAEWFRRNLATEVSKGLREKATRGHALGLAAFGYRIQHQINPRTGERIKGTDQLLQTEDAPIVAEIFALHCTGQHSDMTIGRELNRRGLLHLDPQTGERKVWSRDTIRGILTNPLYAGWVMYQGERFEGVHEPIVSRADWEHSQAIRGRRAGQRTAHVAARGTGSLFSDLAACACCYGPMHAWMSGEGANRQRMYYCRNRRQLSKDVCGARLVPERLVLDHLRNFFRLLVLPQGVMESAVRTAWERAEAPPVAPPQRAHDVALRMLKEQFLNDEISAAAFEEARQQLLAQPAPTPSASELQVFDLPTAAGYLRDLPRLFAGADTLQQRQLLATVFRRVYLDKCVGMKAIVPQGLYRPILGALAAHYAAREVSAATPSGLGLGVATVFPEIWDAAA